MFRTNKERNRKELGYRKSNEIDRNQNTETNTPATPSAVSDQVRSRVASELDKGKLIAAEGTLIKDIIDKEERRKRNLEMAELLIIWERNMHQMREITGAKIMKARWARYMKCDGSPDPVDQREINTYISLRLENRSNDTVDNVLNDSKLDLQLIEELKSVLLDAPSEMQSEEDRTIYLKTIADLQKLIMYKLDIASLQVMCDATVLANKETGNLQHAVMIDDIALCLWGNIMKNPRIRSYEFPEIYYTFEIPRMIALTDCAVRVLTTKFDLYSPTSKSIIPRMKKVKESEPIEPEQKEEKKEIEEDKDEGNKDPTVAAEIEEKEEVKVNIITNTSSEVSGDVENVEEEEPEDKEDTCMDPPTPEPTEWEDFDEEDEVVNLRAYNILGGIYHFNLLQLPPQPKFVKSWTITQMVDPPELHYLDYMADDGVSRDESKKEERPPIAVSLVFPDDVLCLEQPQAARWDYETKFWTTRGFSNITYAEGRFMLPYWTKNRPEVNSIRGKWFSPAELIFVMKKVGINIFPNEDSVKFVNIQNKHPRIEERLYQQMALTASAMAYSRSKWNWKLLEKNQIIFQGTESLVDEAIPMDVWSTFLATKFRVLKLMMMDAEEQLENVKRNLLPFDPISLGSGSYASSKISQSMTLDRFKENLVYPTEDESQLTRASSRASKLPSHLNRMAYGTKTGPSKRTKVKEGSKTAREQFLEIYNIQKSQFKSNIYHLMPLFASERGLNLVSTTSFQFVNCVYKLLTATKVLSYS